MTIFRSTSGNSPIHVVVFPTNLGWMAMARRAGAVRELTFAHESVRAARAAITCGIAELAILKKDAASPTAARSLPGVDERVDRIVKMLQAYAGGRRVDFSDVEVDESGMTDFGRRVIRACRKIPYGQTVTYKELAAKAGNPAAARAVGHHMAKNRIPIIVPCHRVLPCGKGLGGFSARGGVEMKRRLLEMEAGSANSPDYSQTSS